MCYETFSRSLDEAVSLLELSKKSEIANAQDAQLILRSAVVLSVAFWQNYHESYVRKISETFMRRCRKSEKLPKLIRKNLAAWVMREKKTRKNHKIVASLVWEFADGEWRDYYNKHVEQVVSKLNTPNTENINKLYVSILGQKEIADNWSSNIRNLLPQKSIDYILDVRHEIAHGSFNSQLSHNKVLKMIVCLRENAEKTYHCASSIADNIMEGFGKPYTLDDFDLSGLIKWLAKNPTKIPFAVGTLSKIKSLWFSNQKKLSHISWDLLEGPVKARKTTQRFRQFIDGQLSLPYEIISFGGKDSMPKPGTKMVYFKVL